MEKKVSDFDDNVWANIKIDKKRKQKGSKKSWTRWRKYVHSSSGRVCWVGEYNVANSWKIGIGCIVD